MLIIYTRNTTFEHRNTTFGHSEGNTPRAVLVTVSHAFLNVKCRASQMLSYHHIRAIIRKSYRRKIGRLVSFVVGWSQAVSSWFAEISLTLVQCVIVNSD